MQAIPTLSTAVTNDVARQSHPDRWLLTIAFAASASFLFALIAYNFVDIDIWHQMALIRESLSAGHLLRQDPYAYTPTIHPWIDHEWGAGVLAYFATAWFGPRAILMLKFVAAFGTAAACLFCARLRGTDFRLVALCGPLAIYLMYLGFLATVRAQAYSFALTAILLCLLEIDTRGTRLWIALWLVVFPIWLNLHAGFVVGIAIVALHALEQAYRGAPWRHLLFVVSAMAAEILINPYGFAYFGYLRRAVFMPRPYSPEWGSFLTLGGPLATAFLIALLTGIYGVLKGGWKFAQGLPILLATAIEGAFHRKLMPLLAIAWLCFVPAYLQRTPIAAWWLAFCSRRRLFLSFACGLFAGVCIFAGLRQSPWRLAVPQPLYPVGPVLYLQQQKFTGNLLVPFRIGAFVSWELYPAVKVSLDGRYEVTYPDTVVKRIFDFYDARPGWQSTLAAYPTDVVLFPRDALVLKAFVSTGWRRIYTDRQFEIYARPDLALPVDDWSATRFEGTFP